MGPYENLSTSVYFCYSAAVLPRDSLAVYFSCLNEKTFRLKCILASYSAHILAASASTAEFD